MSWRRPDISSWSRDGRTVYMRREEFHGMDVPLREYLYAGTVHCGTVRLDRIVPMIDVPQDHMDFPDHVVCRYCRRAHPLTCTTVAESAAKADGWRMEEHPLRDLWVCGGCQDLHDGPRRSVKVLKEG